MTFTSCRYGFGISRSLGMPTFAMANISANFATLLRYAKACKSCNTGNVGTTVGTKADNQ